MWSIKVLLTLFEATVVVFIVVDVVLVVSIIGVALLVVVGRIIFNCAQ